MRRALLHLTAWLAVFVGWLLVTRPYHPTRTIAIGATAVLVSTSALATYADRLVLVPRFARQSGWRAYVVSLSATVAALDLSAVLLISLIYDWLWHPDPLRFGFWFNVASDGVIIGGHVVAVRLLVLTIRFIRGAAPEPSPS
jgi:drug/metabolite transporter (DMT)-like permease